MMKGNVNEARRNKYRVDVPKFFDEGRISAVVQPNTLECALETVQEVQGQKDEGQHINANPDRVNEFVLQLLEVAEFACSIQTAHVPLNEFYVQLWEPEIVKVKPEEEQHHDTGIDHVPAHPAGIRRRLAESVFTWARTSVL